MSAYAEEHTASIVQAAGALWSSGVTSSTKSFIIRGCNPFGVRRVGTSRYDEAGIAGVLVFSLPSVEQLGSVESASLEWTLESIHGSPSFSVDLYGLGYTMERNPIGACFFEGQRDSLTPEDYGLAGPRKKSVALIQHGVMRPDSQTGRIVIKSRQFRRYLESLYRNGARGGDLVVFRLSADTSTNILPRKTGYNVVLPPSIHGYTSLSELPVLRLTAHVGDNL